jgi:hypothetical protein
MPTRRPFELLASSASIQPRRPRLTDLPTLCGRPSTGTPASSRCRYAISSGYEIGRAGCHAHAPIFVTRAKRQPAAFLASSGRLSGAFDKDAWHPARASAIRPLFLPSPVAICINVAA